jgi:hypothetical protein
MKVIRLTDEEHAQLISVLDTYGGVLLSQGASMNDLDTFNDLSFKISFECEDSDGD